MQVKLQYFTKLKWEKLFKLLQLLVRFIFLFIFFIVYFYLSLYSSFISNFIFYHFIFVFYSFFFFFILGFNVETVKRKNLSFSVWDVGGQDQVMTIFIIFYLFYFFFLYFLLTEVCFFFFVKIDSRSLETLLFKYCCCYFRC